MTLNDIDIYVLESAQKIWLCELILKNLIEQLFFHQGSPFIFGAIFDIQIPNGKIKVLKVSYTLWCFWYKLEKRSLSFWLCPYIWYQKNMLYPHLFIHHVFVKKIQSLPGCVLNLETVLSRGVFPTFNLYPFIQHM